jgi:hypothetical protein
MTDSARQVWVMPDDPNDLAPLPALKRGERLFADYSRREKTFGDFYEDLFLETYPSFDECRAAMIDARVEQLDEAREHARNLANAIEHIRTIPATPFPSDALQHNLQQQQEEAVQEEAKTEEVIELANGSSITLKPSEDPGPLKSARQLKRPSRRG